MLDRPVQADSKPTTEADKNYYAPPPVVSLPKGGGAIKGMGEKFAANPVTGTGSMSVPIATSPGRSGFGPQLSLSYDSGAGNGIFGLGWNLSLPSIMRKTDKGLPRYCDTEWNAEKADVFILSGAEDLLPVLQTDGTVDETLRDGYCIRKYRPRIEGLFARIERWTKVDSGETHWRSISKDNITTLYGKTKESRIADPSDSNHVFSWLICESYDDKGNAIYYGYKSEDTKKSVGINTAQAHEGNRTPESRSANRYLKRIQYGNLKPRQPNEDLSQQKDWLFEVVFDYGEHDLANPIPKEPEQWSTATLRNDPFSSYRSGFEVRTYRLCQRVLMFHHFEGEAGVGKDCLVRSTDFTYSYEQNPKDARNPIYSFLLSVSQTGYKRSGGGYIKKSLPPLEFTYSEANIDETVRDVDRASLENLPQGVDGTRYQWVDLDGEGLSGILTEQGNGWFYKRNLSPINAVQDNGKTHVEAQFAPLELVASKPASGLANGAQFLDLAGDGQPDVVTFRGAVPGFYERTQDKGWEPFTAFKSLPVVDWDNPNLKFIDLNGDGHSDILISEDHCFVWYPSLAEDGFAAAERVIQPWDEEKGPRVIFADSTQSIHLADMSGDGLTDIVRIRNGEVCYWPNLGYGKFGTKVTMDHAPWFDRPDIFNQQRIQLADIDGSGTTDILYLSGEGVQVYFNQSGNGWAAKQTLSYFPAIDNVASITAFDLLGNGTACLVWSSPLLGNGRRVMRYIDLMGGQKPHLLVKTVNNLGAETVVEYAPSTKFYLQGKLAGKPWITKLPFPVHVVEKVTVTDKWRKTIFTSTYSYHHGYFDGIEREFRGFGRVEQVDSESYGEFAKGNVASPYITKDKTLYQPPVKTVTWYHTGAFLDREQILSQFKHEYFSLGTFAENGLPEPDLEAEALGAEEWREALRACKGMMLRQEVYELDVDALELGEHRPVKLFSTAYHNCHIRRLQAKGQNQHAVFLVAESEAITYHYELDLTQDKVRPDPRIAHTLNLQFDEYANVLQSVAIVYPRLGKFEDDANLADGLTDALTLIDQVQKETHIAYSETRYTEDFGDRFEDKEKAQDNHRLRLPCEVLTYELTGIKPRSGPYFTLDELRGYRLSLVHQTSGEAVQEIAYHQLPDRTLPPTPPKKEKRLVEQVRMLFFRDDPADPAALKEPLTFGRLGCLGLPYETYKLALTEDLLNAVFKKDLVGNNKLDETIDRAITARAKLNAPIISGYLSGAKLAARITGVDTTGQYWIRSGIAGFANDAADHFYLPERYTDPFDNVTTLAYDPRDLFIMSSTDAMSNTTRVTKFDFRVLAPREIQDINNNLSEVYFDVLGMPTVMAVKGKGNEGDNLIGITDGLANPTTAELAKFFNQSDLDQDQARTWLGNGTARHLYYFGETEEKLADGTTVIHWGQHPACACGIVREQHVSQLEPNAQSPLQASFEYSDGMGSVVVKKVQAEPEKAGQPIRWVASGKTILNNKGKPVKQYEPYFSAPAVGHQYEEPIEVGVTPVIYYDAVGRTVRTEMPDRSFSRVEFSPWHVRTFDPNDTVKDSQWYTDRNPPNPDQPLPRNPITGELLVTPEQRAAWLAAQHANTPALTILDSLGRDVIAIAHNRVKDVVANVLKEDRYLTFTKLDAEGKPLWIRDARKNLVMQYIRPAVPNNQAADPVEKFVPCYDIAGNLLFQHSMDAGDRWMLNDAAGKPMCAWDNLGRAFRTDYDALHRPVGSFVKGAKPDDPNRIVQFEKVIYGDTPENGLSDDPKSLKGDQTRNLNLRGKPYQHYDTAGLVTSLGRNPATGAEEAFDFKGNPLRSARQLIEKYKETPDWSQNSALEKEIFSSSTRYDALNRPIQMVAPHSDRVNTKFNVIRPGYNEANLLERVDVWLGQTAEPTALLEPTTANLKAVTNIDYDAKGQRIRIEYNEANHPVITEYTYDRETFRLSRLLSTRPKHLEADKRTLQDLSYTYDPVGNITEIRDKAQQRVFFNNSLINPSNTYTYDALYRLVLAEGREHAVQNNVQRDAKKFEPIEGIPFPNSPEALQNYTEAYQYDPVGNILEFRHTGGEVERWVRKYQYALDSNRLLATRLPGEATNLPDYAAIPGYGAQYAYDDHGNMKAMPHLKVMEWDFKDQLHATQPQVVNNGTGERTYYVYDAGGQRVRKVTETQNSTRKDERIYLGGFEVYRKYNGNRQAAVLERETLHVMDDRQRIVLVETKTITNPDDKSPVQLIRFQLGNHLGSAALELDDQAQVISYEEYHPYGSTAYHAARSLTETAKRYRYTGKERDEETGFSYHGARYYAPWLGRWVSCDPIGIGDGVNIYAYAHLNPITITDVNGTDGDLADMSDPKNVHTYDGTPVNDYWRYGVRSKIPAASLSGGTTSNTTSSSAPAKPAPTKSVATAPKEADVHQLKAYAYASTNAIGRWESGLGTAVSGAVLIGGSLVVIVGSGGTATPFVLAGATMALGAGVTGVAVGSFQLTQPISRGNAQLSEVTQLTMDLGSSPVRLLSGTAGAVYTGDEAGLRSGIAIGGKIDLAINLRSLLSKSSSHAATEEMPSDVPQEYVPDLSHVTGKGANARNIAIESAIEEDLPDLKLTYPPQYNPFIRTGIARQGEGTQIGRNRFSTRLDLNETIVHEELHHRWWQRGLQSPHHPNLASEIKESDFFHYTVARYLQFRGLGPQVMLNTERRALEAAGH